MNHKLTLEWQERMAGKKKDPKYDSKALKKVSIEPCHSHASYESWLYTSSILQLAFTKCMW
jgi:hypothetical protein